MVERGPAGQLWDASTDCAPFRFTDLIDELDVHPCDGFRSGSFSNNERLGAALLRLRTADTPHVVVPGMNGESIGSRIRLSGKLQA